MVTTTNQQKVMTQFCGGAYRTAADIEMMKKMMIKETCI